MSIPERILACLLLIVLGACSSPPGPPPLAVPDQRYDLVGAAVFPPRDEGWFVVRHTEQNLVFFKSGSTKMGTRGAWLLSWDEDKMFPNAEAFRAEMESRIRSEFEDERFRLLELEVSLDSSRAGYALKTHAKSADYQVPGFEGEFMLMESFGRIFLHPDDSSMGVWVDYSERSDPGTGIADLQAQAEAYIASLEILDLGG